jgi:hypothetical protein
MSSLLLSLGQILQSPALIFLAATLARLVTVHRFYTVFRLLVQRLGAESVRQDTFKSCHFEQSEKSLRRLPRTTRNWTPPVDLSRPRELIEEQQ